MGRKEVSAEALRWTVERGFDVVAVMTDSHLSESPTAQVAAELKLPLHTYESASAAIVAGDLSFDLGVSLVYWRILKEPFLSHPKLGIINFHPAPLPQYKGTAGYNMAIMDELEKWAVTAHYIDNGIDTGDIIEVLEFSFDHKEATALSLERTSQQYLLALFKNTIERTRENGVLPAKSNEGGRYICRDEMEAMKEIRPLDDIDKKIRAFWFPPYTGAFIELEGKKYTLINSTILEALVDPTVTGLHSAKKVS